MCINALCLRVRRQKYRIEENSIKKILLIALLMLALMITTVACHPTTDEPDTSADNVTTAETPTEADLTAKAAQAEISAPGLRKQPQANDSV
jgi:hypothetical protein